MRLPYTVGLVATGLALALARLPLDLALTHDVLFEVILPPLLFEAALSISWRELKRDLAPVLALSTVGVLVGAGGRRRRTGLGARLAARRRRSRSAR